MTPRLRLLQQMASSSDPALSGQAKRELQQRDEDRARSKAMRKARRGLAPGRTKAQRKQEKNETTSEVREAVWARAAVPSCSSLMPVGRCECGCGRAIFKTTFHMDHFFGGSDRNESNTVEGCWALHPHCDRQKTAYQPDRGAWLWRYRAHCERLGYAEQITKVDGALALYEAQHPEARKAATT